MDEKWGVLEYMKKRIEQNGLCVVVIAEGAGQVGLLLYNALFNFVHNPITHFKVGRLTKFKLQFECCRFKLATTWSRGKYNVDKLSYCMP
jgi:hypothetical protein